MFQHFSSPCKVRVAFDKQLLHASYSNYYELTIGYMYFFKIAIYIQVMEKLYSHHNYYGQ